MRFLVLAGTAWLGRCIATTAVERGHRVTCLARGESGAPPPGAAFTRADRDGPGALQARGRGSSPPRSTRFPSSVTGSLRSARL